MPSDVAIGDNFGNTVAIQGDYIIVSAHTRAPFEGQVYIFQISTDSTQIQEIPNPDAAAGGNAQFGFVLSVDLPVLAIGAPFDNNIVNSGGVVYMYELTGVTFTQRQKNIPT